MRQAGLGSLTAIVDAALARLRRHIPPGSAEAYAFAFTCMCGATLFDVWLVGVDPEVAPLSGYYPAIALTTLLAGIVPGRAGCGFRRLDRLVGLHDPGP
jgi:hypothetical protein